MNYQEVINSPDGEKFQAAGYQWLPAGGGMYAWQKRIGDFVLQAGWDWETDSPFWVVSAHCDDGSFLVLSGEWGVDEALRHLARIKLVPPAEWRGYALERRDEFEHFA